MAGTTTGAAPGNDRLASAPTEHTRDPGRRPVTSPEAALRRMLSAARPVTESERVATLAALTRVLAETQYSTIQVPPSDNSAMDGYVVVAGDIPAESETQLPIVQRIAAGYSGARLLRGTAARIFTGGPIPEGGDAVVMQERCRVEDGRVCIRGPVEAGEHVRRAGEDIARGERILEARARLRPQDLGLAASERHRRDQKNGSISKQSPIGPPFHNDQHNCRIEMRRYSPTYECVAACRSSRLLG